MTYSVQSERHTAWAVKRKDGTYLTLGTGSQWWSFSLVSATLWENMADAAGHSAKAWPLSREGEALTAQPVQVVLLDMGGLSE